MTSSSIVECLARAGEARFSGSARVSRADLGVSPKSLIRLQFVLGETPRTARETRALPGYYRYE